MAHWCRQRRPRLTAWLAFKAPVISWMALSDSDAPEWRWRWSCCLELRPARIAPARVDLGSDSLDSPWPAQSPGAEQDKKEAAAGAATGAAAAAAAAANEDDGHKEFAVEGELKQEPTSKDDKPNEEPELAVVKPDETCA